MLVTLDYLLKLAEQKNCAILAPDFTTLGVARAMIEQAEEIRVPLILSFSVGFKSIIDVSSYRRFIEIVRSEIEQASVPICLHLDHATSLEDIREAVDVGYTSVMIDASAESWEVNIERTLKTVEMARPLGISVESELGTITSGEGYYKQDSPEAFFTDPELAEEFVRLTKIDALAVSIGNVHGAYQGEPQIDFARLEELERRVEVPLVLHGTSGIGAENLERAVHMGIRKINLYSDIIYRMHANMLGVLQTTLMDPVSLIQVQSAGVKSVIVEYANLLGSCN